MVYLRDVLLALPKLRAIGTLNPEVTCAGACGPGDGAIAGWLIVARDGQPRELVADYREAAGLIWCGTPPPDLIAAAGAAGLPLLAADTITPAEVYAAVATLTAQPPQQRTWRRLTAAERLGPALVAARPETELLRRFSALTGETVALLDIDARVIAATGELPTRSVARHLRGHTEATASFRLGRWAITARRLGGQWLIRGHREDILPDPASPEAAAAAELLTVLAESRRVITRDALADSTALLTALTSAESDKEAVREALVRRGFSETARMRFIVCAPTPSDRVQPPESVADASAQIATRESVPLVVGAVANRTTALTTDSHAFGAIARALPSERVGFSAPLTGVERAPAAWREGLVAAASGHLASFERCSAIEQAAARLSAAELDASVAVLDASLAAVKQGRELAEALVATQFSPAAAARALGVHPNTVRNRLAEVRDRTRVDPADLRLWSLWRALS